MHTRTDTHIHKMHTDSHGYIREDGQCPHSHTPSHTQGGKTHNTASQNKTAPPHAATHMNARTSLLCTPNHTTYTTQHTRERERDEDGKAQGVGEREGGEGIKQTPHDHGRLRSAHQSTKAGGQQGKNIHPWVPRLQRVSSSPLPGCTRRDAHNGHYQYTSDTEDRQAGKELESHFAHRQTMTVRLMFIVGSKKLTRNERYTHTSVDVTPFILPVSHPDGRVLFVCQNGLVYFFPCMFPSLFGWLSLRKRTAHQTPHRPTPSRGETALRKRTVLHTSHHDARTHTGACTRTRTIPTKGRQEREEQNKKGQPATCQSPTHTHTPSTHACTKPHS